MVQKSLIAILYCVLLISCLSDHLVYTNGYRDNRNNIVQRRPTIRTENDNFVVESPRGRNITLSPGEGGFVKIGNTVIDPKAATGGMNGPTGPAGPPGAPGPKGDPGETVSVEQLLARMREEIAATVRQEVAAQVAALEAALEEKVAELERYTWKDTFPAIFEFYTHDYGERLNSSTFGHSGLVVLTDEGGIIFGQQIRATDLVSGTTYALTFYLINKEGRRRNLDLTITGSDLTDVLINDRVVRRCGDYNGVLQVCNDVEIPADSFKLTLKVSDSQDVLEGIGFASKWLTVENLAIDWDTMNSVIRKKSPSKRRKK